MIPRIASLARWHRAFGLVAGLTLISRVLGFLRDVLLAAILGTGPSAIVLMLALRLTSQFRAILAEGAFTAAFQPIDADYQAANTDGEQFRSEVLGWLFLANLILLGVVLVAPGLVLRVFAPGYEPDDAVYTIARDLLRITFPYLPSISVMAYFAARLGGQGRFGASPPPPLGQARVLFSRGWRDCCHMDGVRLLAGALPHPLRHFGRQEGIDMLSRYAQISTKEQNGVRFCARLETKTARWPSGVRTDPEFVMPTMG